MRIDFDPIRGPHINVKDCRIGKGSKGISIAIPFKGSELDVNKLLKHMNTITCHEHVKNIFSVSGETKDLSRIMHTIAEIKKPRRLQRIKKLCRYKF
jgi:hypothetical protein